MKTTAKETRKGRPKNEIPHAIKQFWLPVPLIDQVEADGGSRKVKEILLAHYSQNEKAGG